jgi:ubiquinone/menaquinone biosynthesis C-methylase UbiE
MAARTDNRAYYDAFASGYDDERADGYHRLIDDQAAELVRRVGEGRECLEVGCGTGLILDRVNQFASRAEGVDLSPGMLDKARDRGLTVQEADATKLPFEDASFDVAYSFKVLAHVPDLRDALAEMARVVRPGGHLVFDMYNRHSARWLVKRLFGPRNTSQTYDEAAITTRYSSIAEQEALFPRNTRRVDLAGIRVATLHPAVHRLPVIGGVAGRLEWALMDSLAARLAGFVVFTLERI